MTAEPEDYTVPDDDDDDDIVRVYFADGADSAMIDIEITNDEDEENDTFTVTIVDADNPIHATDYVTTVNIVNDDGKLTI